MEAGTLHVAGSVPGTLYGVPSPEPCISPHALSPVNGGCLGRLPGSPGHPEGRWQSCVRGAVALLGARGRRLSPSFLLRV